MRCTTAAQAKAKHLKYRGGPLRERPREGTRVGSIYDLLQANKGAAVEVVAGPEIGPILASLRDFYGLDIRHVERRNQRLGTKCKYVLAGEWFGRVYIDYVAGRIEGQPQ